MGEREHEKNVKVEVDKPKTAIVGAALEYPWWTPFSVNVGFFDGKLSSFLDIPFYRNSDLCEGGI